MFLMAWQFIQEWISRILCYCQPYALCYSLGCIMEDSFQDSNLRKHPTKLSLIQRKIILFSSALSRIACCLFSLSRLESVCVISSVNTPYLLYYALYFQSY